MRRMQSAVINKAREQLMERRYEPKHVTPLRWTAVRFEGRLHRCTVDGAKTRSGRLYNLRLRLLRRFDFRAFY